MVLTGNNVCGGNLPKSLVHTAMRISVLLQGLQASGEVNRGQEKKTSQFGARTHIKLQESSYMLISPLLWSSKDFLHSRSHVHEQKM